MRALPPEEDEHLMAVGAVPADWRTRRRMSTFALLEPLPFLDVDSPETHTFLTKAMASELKSHGIENLDVSILRSSNRFLTRAIAEWAYVASEDDGTPLYSGLRYESRLGPFECWAIFAGSTVVPQQTVAIQKTDDALLRVARTFDLTVH